MKSLRTHFAAMHTAELRVGLRIRDDEIVAGGFAHPRSPVTFVKAASLAACADSSGCPNGTKRVLPRGLTSLDDRQCLAR